jgi:hypothetical protein
MSSILDSPEYAIYSKQIDDARAAYRAEKKQAAEQEKHRRSIYLKKIKEAILDNTWERYVPFDDILDFIQSLDDELIKLFYNNKYNIITAINKYGLEGTYIKHCDYATKNDAEVVYAAVANCPCAIQYVDNDELLEDKELAMIAVKINGLSLEHFPYFQNNETVVFLACEQNGEAIQYASDELKQYKTLALTALESNSAEKEYFVFYELIERFQNDKDCILCAIKHDERDIEFSISDELKKDPDIYNALKLAGRIY